jgi:DNA repair exonuclease SbcCD nuclease subunit
MVHASQREPHFQFPTGYRPASPRSFMHRLFAALRSRYQYWALGHVHNRQVLCADPYIVYPGNIQGRHGKEQGEKSCELVTVADAGTISISPISTSVVPWIESFIDASGCQNADEVYDKLRTTLGALVLQAKDRVSIPTRNVPVLSLIP